jgi:hypothetical protein
MVYLIRTPLSSNISIEQVRTQLTFTDDTVNELIPLLDRVTITEMGGKELEREQKVMKVKNTPIHLYTNTPIHLYTYTPIHLCTYVLMYLCTYVLMYFYFLLPHHMYVF